MATRNSSSTSSSHAAAAMGTEAATDAAAGAQASIADITRQQMASTASAASAMLRAMENIQQTQQHLLQRTALLQEQMAQRLRAATTPVEVLAIQSSSVMSGWSEWAQYTQELMLASLKAQNELVRPGQAAQLSAAEAAPSTVNTTTAPFMQAWQAMFNLPMAAYGAQVASPAGRAA